MQPANSLETETTPSIISQGIDANQYSGDLRDRLTDFIIKHRSSVNDIATEINRKPSSVAAYIRGTFRGDNAKLEAHLRDFLKKHEKIEAPSTESGFLPLSASQIIWEAALFCAERREMGVFITPAGFSKTRTAQELLKKNKSDFALITAAVDRQSLGALFDMIYQQINGCGFWNLSNAEKKEAIIDRLKSRQFRLLLVDEAQFTPWIGFEIMKDLHDQAGIGVLYLGTERILDEMRGRKGHSWDQITSRIGIYRKLEIVERRDIEKLASQILPGISKSCTNIVHEFAQGPGKLRTAVKILSRAADLHGRGTEINPTVLREITSMLLI